MKKFEILLSEIDTLPITKQFESMIELSNDILNQNKYCEEPHAIELILDKIHALRYKLSYNKGTDSGLKDAELKQVWEKLNSLLKI